MAAVSFDDATSLHAATSEITCDLSHDSQDLLTKPSHASRSMSVCRLALRPKSTRCWPAVHYQTSCRNRWPLYRITQGLENKLGFGRRSRLHTDIADLFSKARHDTRWRTHGRLCFALDSSKELSTFPGDCLESQVI